MISKSAFLSKPAKRNSPWLVVLNDTKLVAELICEAAEEIGLNVAGFTDEEKAFEFLVKKGTDVCSVWTDTMHPESATVNALIKLNRIALPIGVYSHLNFLYGAVHSYAPEAEVVFHGGWAGGSPIDWEIAEADERVRVFPPHFRIDQIVSHTERAVALWKTRQRNGPIPIDVATVDALSDELAVVCGKVPELLDRLTPRQFEEMVGAIFRNNGFRVELTSYTKDGGYDLMVVSNSSMKPEVAIVEVKHYRSDRPVGVAIVRQLYGVRSLREIPRCYLVTSSSVSKYAKREFSRVVPRQLEFIQRNDILQWCKTHHASVLRESVQIKEHEIP
jgi:Restriction endonuclease